MARARGGQLFLVGCLLLIASLPLAMPISIDQMNGKPPGSHPTGKPCGRITEAVFHRGWTSEPHVFTFSGVTFARRRADADCDAGKRGLLGVVGPIYPICRFDAPYQLAVTSRGRTLYYAVPAGYTAVVAARPEGTSCVVTDRYDIYDLANQ